MNMITNLQGRIRNTSLPLSNGLLPLFEAVVNSIHAIEEANLPSAEGKVLIEILRSQQTTLELSKNKKNTGSVEDITGFKIVDNGIGFTDLNIQSFKTLDTDHKTDKSCRGVGRLLWLKAFRKVKIDSIFFDEDGKLKRRHFLFDGKNGVDSEQFTAMDTDAKRITTVYLDGFIDKYRNASLKTTLPISVSLFEHCLWYFVREGGAPKILVKDSDNEIVQLDEIYEEYMASGAVIEQESIKGQTFDLTHIRLRKNSTHSHSLAFCASNRLVKEESLNGKIPGLYGNLIDKNGSFYYSCYVSSEYLDEKVRSERTGFDIANTKLELFKDTEITFDDIRNTVIDKATIQLSEYLVENKKKSRERVEKFVSKKAPRYRPILKRIPENKIYFDPNISDSDLELILHKFLSEIERELLKEGHLLMNPVNDDTLEEYKNRLREYLDKLEDVKKSDLAGYVSHRKVIIDLLEKSIRPDTNNKYSREDVIHNLIMPMGKDTNDLMFENSNLWIIDERLAFHNYLASDKALTSIPVTSSSDRKEPDLFSLNIFDNPILVSEGATVPLASIVVVEIKRPMRNDASEGIEKDPIEQALDYLDKIRNGEVLTKSGRPIPQSENIPGFCYVICDITTSIKKRCRVHDAVKTSDGLGYFFYHKEFRAYVEILSYDRLVNSAKERNKAFFDKLGIATS